jgi:endonuclease/exonuclease/phosphatase family metal-dependent hydrolase
MGWNKSRLGLLIALAACDSVDRDPVPVWMAWDQLDGRFRPELVQPPVTMLAKPALRLVSYNVLRGVDLAADAAFFETDPDLASADVIALQESWRPVDGPRSDAGDFAELLHMGYVYVPTFEFEGNFHGIALLSRFPLIDVEVMLLLATTDLETEEQAARAALRATIVTSAGPIQVVNVHLDPPLNVPERILQLRPAVIDPQAPVAVLGDFNTNDYVWVAEQIPLVSIDGIADTSQADALDGYMQTIGYDTPTADFGKTWHGFPEDQRLDSIFTRGLRTGAGAVERELDTSDHWPIWLDVRVP